MTIRCGVLDDALRRADMESARRCPSSADEGRQPTSGRESRALGGDGRVCASTVAFTKRRYRDMDAERLGVTPLSSNPVLETRSSESPRARPRVVASGSHGTVTCDHHERAGGCVRGIVLQGQRSITRSAALGASGGWCPSTPTMLRRLRLGPDGRQPRVHALGRCGRPRPGSASIAYLPRPCRAEASSMPEGPATGRVAAQRRALTTASTAPDSRTRCWPGHCCRHHSVHMRAHRRCQPGTTSSLVSRLVSPGRSRRSTGSSAAHFVRTISRSLRRHRHPPAMA